MLDNNIDTIIQTGDLLDNRTTMDIFLFITLRERFFDILKKHNFKFITYIGNHDMYYKNTRDTNMVELIAELYPNVVCYRNQELMELDGIKIGMIPFLTPDESINEDILKNSDYVFGHFETSGFEISKGIVDNHSKLEASSFQKYSNIKTVFSGHYHIKNTEGFMKYVGIPYNTTWNDYGNSCGFHVLDLRNNKLDFYENVHSDRYVKMIYDGNLNIDGIKFSTEDFRNYLKTNSNIIVKLYLFNTSLEDNSHEVLISQFRECNTNFAVIDNREEINTLDINKQELKLKNIQSTDAFLHDFIKENHIELFELFLELMNAQKVD